MQLKLINKSFDPEMRIKGNKIEQTIYRRNPSLNSNPDRKYPIETFFLHPLNDGT